MRVKLFVFALVLAQTVHAQKTLTEEIYDVLQARDNGRGKDSAYALSSTNALPADWLLQTPNIWGLRTSSVVTIPLCSGANCERNFRLPVCDDGRCTAGKCVTLRAAGGKKLCAGAADEIVDQIYDVVAKGGTLVDVATLGTPDERFLAALRNAMTELARSQKEVVVRVLLGAPAGVDVRFEQLRNEMVRDARAIPGSKLQLYVLAYRQVNLSWNHAKIIANDTTAIVGGHNMWTNDYLLKNLVHDVSMKVEGPAATASHQYVDRIWASLCPTARPASYDARRSPTDFRRCERFPAAPAAPGTGAVPVLAVGNYASIIGDEKSRFMSDLARNEAIRRAKTSIRLSQQDVGFKLGLGPIGTVNRWPDETLSALGDRLIDGLHVWVVLSSHNSLGGDNPYQWGIPPFVTLNKIAQAAKRNPRAPQGNDLVKLLCSNLHFAALRFNDTDDAWPSSARFANHAKTWLVDDKALYIGSDNVYPAYLQEYGYIVENANAVNTFREQYWNPLWKASERTATSGGKPGSPCQLRCEMTTPANFFEGYGNKPRGFYDVNGDGQADYCRAIGNDRLGCAIATPSGFAEGGFGSPERFNFGDAPRGLADVNGDAKADYCRFNGRVLSCALSTGDPNHPRGRFVDGLFGNAKDIDPGYTDYPRAFIDVSGDGLADFCRFVRGRGPFRISCQLATAYGWHGGVVESAADIDVGIVHRFFVDIEGKGKASYCRAFYERGLRSLRCATSDGTKFVDNTYTTVGNFDFGSDPRGFADVNGDGLLDYCRFRGETLDCAINWAGSFLDGKWTARLPAGKEPHGFSDVNGDGMADFCRVVDKQFRCAVSTGQRGAAEGTFSDSFHPLEGFAVGKEPWGFAHTFGDVGNAYCRMVDGVGLMCTNLPVCHKN